MAYQVIARKWRPQTFEEVTGQELITRTLRGSIEHDRLHHAYLFSGARGVGKTTTARLLAKALNCHRSDRPTPTPCQTTDETACPSCREIAEGRSIDVLEIDAASNTGVDNVREAIINTVGIRPARDRYKVFIIDEVHMLSGAAFNALLKTLEEPPPRVVFIMATTESHKLPDTILSRCQQFEFRTIPATKIAERLRLIADAEGVKVTDDALREIARAGEGSMRDAQSAFDQVISFSAGSIAVEDVETALGIAGAELRSRVMRAIAENAPAEALAVVDDLVMRGHDLRNFCRDLLAHVRDLLVVKVAGERGGLSDASDAERRELARTASAFSESDLVRFFHSLSETERLLRESAHPRYQLEIGLVKLIEMRRLAPLTEILERLSALEEALRTGKAPAGGAGTTLPPATTPAASGGAPPRRTGSGGAAFSAVSSTPFAESPSASATEFPRESTAEIPQTNGHAPFSSATRGDSQPDESAAFISEGATFISEETAATFASNESPAPFDGTGDAATSPDDVPPFEPLPPRTTPAKPARESRITSLPSLPTSGRQKPPAFSSQTSAPSSTSVSSPSSASSAASTSPPPSLPSSNATRAIPSLPKSGGASSAANSGAPAPASSGLKLVPPPPPETREASRPPSRDSHAPFPELPQPFEDSRPFFEEADAPFFDAPAPGQDHAGRSIPASAKPSTAQTSTGTAAGTSVEKIKRLLDDRRKPFLVIALEGARTVRLDAEELFVEYAPEGKHLRDALAKPENVKCLREVCREVAGREMGVRIVVREAGQDDGAPLTRQDEALLEKQRLREMAEQHPSVQQLLKVFGAEIIDVRRVETTEGQQS